MKYTVAWDDQLAEFKYRCRLYDPKSPWKHLRQTPAVFRFYPEPGGRGEYRIDVSAWKSFFVVLNNDLLQFKFRYWTKPDTAQFNKTGWPKMSYILTSGNILEGIEVVDLGKKGKWLRFRTLHPSDVHSIDPKTNTHASLPSFIHRFSLVGKKKINRKDVTIRMTTTKWGTIDYPLVTEAGFGYIPLKYAIPIKA